MRTAIRRFTNTIRRLWGGLRPARPVYLSARWVIEHHGGISQPFPLSRRLLDKAIREKTKAGTPTP